MMVKLSYVIYLIAIFTFLGSIVFTVFFGIGLAALPFDHINIYRKRPKPLRGNDLLEAKKKYAKLSLDLITRIDALYAKLLTENFSENKLDMRKAIERNDKDRIFGKDRKAKREYVKL